MMKLCDILGTPDPHTWPEGYILAENRGFAFPNCEKQDLGSILKTASAEALDCIEWMLQYNPKMRPSVSQVLTHPFFTTKSADPEFSELRDKDTFDSLKVGTDGIKVKRNQKFGGDREIIRPLRNIYKHELETIPKPKPRHSLVQQLEQRLESEGLSNYNNSDDISTNFDSGMYNDSALLANERISKFNAKHVGEVRGLLNKLSNRNHQSTGDLHSNSVFKSTGLHSIEKPPLKPRLPKLQRVEEEKQTDNKPQNSLRRSKTWKTLKKMSENERASAPMSNFNLNRNNDPSLYQEMDRLNNLGYNPMPAREDPTYYSEISRLSSPMYQQMGYLPPSMPRAPPSYPLQDYIDRQFSGNR